MKLFKKHIKVKIALAVFVVLATSTLLGALATDSMFDKNESGQTLGSMSGLAVEEGPDLVEAVGIDGTIGYVKKTDVFRPVPSSPEEALKLQREEDAKGVYTVPLYDKDGKTIIGEFLMGNGSVEEQKAFISSRLDKN